MESSDLAYILVASISLLAAPIAALVTWTLSRRKERTDLTVSLTTASGEVVDAMNEVLNVIRRELDETKAELDETKAELDEIKAQNKILMEENVRLLDEIEQLKAMIQIAGFKKELE